MISVIIPTFGRPENLKRAINSVLDQTYSDFELIIVDDNGMNTLNNQLTKKIVSSFSDKRIIYIEHEKNLNGSAARNTGISVAKGEFISFLDDDDIYYPKRLEVCLTALENANANYGGVYTGCLFKKNDKFYRSIKKTQSGNFLIETLAGEFKLHTGSNIFIRKEVIFNVGVFDTSFIRHQDYEFMVRFFEKYDLLGVNEILVEKNENGMNVPNYDKFYDVKKHFLSKYNYIIRDLTKKDQCYITYSHNMYLYFLAPDADKKRMHLHNALKSRHLKFIDFLRILANSLRR